MPLAPADAGRGAAVLARAFRDYPMMVFLQPDAARRARALPRMLGGIQAYTAAHGLVTTTADLAGVACWLPPGGTVTPWRAVRTGLAGGLLALGPGGVRRAAGLIPVVDQVHAGLRFWGLRRDPR